jgi:hypothetical protein
MIKNPQDRSCAERSVREDDANPEPVDLKAEIQAILDDAPTYDPALNLSVAQVGTALNEVIERLFFLAQRA